MKLAIEDAFQVDSGPALIKAENIFLIRKKQSVTYYGDP